MTNDLKPYTRSDVESARTRGQLIGWVQGAGAAIAIGVVFSLIGWIPTVLLAGGVGYLVYRALFKGRTPAQ